MYFMTKPVRLARIRFRLGNPLAEVRVPHVRKVTIATDARGREERDANDRTDGPKDYPLCLLLQSECAEDPLDNGHLFAQQTNRRS